MLSDIPHSDFIENLFQNEQLTPAIEWLAE